MTMIDIHSHIIYGVDDGAANLYESERMIEAASKLGIETIIATPHYQRRVYESEAVQDKFQLLKLKAEEYQIELFLGCELYANDDLIAYIRRKREKSKFTAQYLLIELPFNLRLEESIRILKRLMNYGMKIIIAHTERNLMLMNEMKQFIDFVRVSDISLQVDAGSVAGLYGLKIKENAKKLINLGMVDFVASNAHNVHDYSSVYSKAVETVYKWCSTEHAIRLLKQNAGSILSIKPLIYNKVLQERSM